MTSRGLIALSRGPAKDSRDMALVMMNSLAQAIQMPPAQWKIGREIPDLVDADPRSVIDPSMHGYNMIPDETRKGTAAYKTDKILAINVYMDHDYSSLAKVSAPLQRMREAVEEVWRDFPEFKRPVVTGRPALDADQMAPPIAKRGFRRFWG